MHSRSTSRLIGEAIACLSIAFSTGNAVADSGDAKASVVGMWHAVLRLGSNGPVYDEILEQFHADGTELLVSNGLPPALGNVCVGVWRQVGPRTYKLKHMTWNWSSDQNEAFGVQGMFSGHFELEMTLRLDERGREFTGAWSARNFDTSGEHIPALDARGVVNATRIPSP
jgi:hypothetical protein